MIVPQRVIDRVLSKYTINEAGCWISNYSAGGHGYSQVGWTDPLGNKTVTVGHRVSWVGTYGEIPEGMTIDHECYERKCVNPEHLRLLSRAENSARWGQDFPLSWACKRNHPIESRRVMKSGWPFCADCKRELASPSAVR